MGKLCLKPQLKLKFTFTLPKIRLAFTELSKTIKIKKIKTHFWGEHFFNVIFVSNNKMMLNTAKIAKRYLADT